MRHLHVTRDGIVIRKVDSPSRHRAIEVYRAASGFGSFFGGAAKKGPLREREREGEGAPLINRRDAIYAPPPPSYFHSISLAPSFSLACSAAGMKGNEPPLRIHFRKIDQPRMDARARAGRSRK